MHAPLRPAVLASLALALATAGGCGDDTADGAKGADTTTPDEERLLRELRRARDEVAKFEASARAQIKNTRSHEETLDKARRIFRGLRVADRIPEERDRESIEQALREAAEAAELELHEIAIEPQPRDERDLPDETVAPKEVRYRPDDLREVIEVRFRATPPDIARLEKLDAELTSSAPRRLVALREAKATPQGFEITAEAFRFVEVEPTEVVARAPTEDEVLEPAAERLLPKLRQRPAVARELEGLREQLAEAERLAERATTALEPIGDTNLVVARTEVLERQVQRLQDRDVADILR